MMCFRVTVRAHRFSFRKCWCVIGESACAFRVVVWVRLRCCFRVSADVLCAAPQFQCYISRILEVVVLAVFRFRGLRLHFCTEYLVSNQFLSQHVGIAALPSLAWFTVVCRSLGTPEFEVCCDWEDP